MVGVENKKRSGGSVKSNKRVTELKCMFTNIRSKMNNNKLDELKHEIEEKEIDILGIAESWTNENITEGEIKIQGYETFRKDRGDKRGGGVLMYVKEGYTAVNISDKTKGLCETVWVTVGSGKKDDLVLGVCYRSPAADVLYDENLIEEIEQFASGRATIMGDFNYGDIDWGTMQADRYSSKNFINRTQDLFLTQHVGEPTRGNNLLDLVFSTEADMVEELEVRNPVANSDHCTLVWKLVMNIILQVNNRKKFNYHRGKYEEIISNLKQVNWDAEFNDKDVESMWATLLAKMNENREKFVPLAKERKSGGQVWMRLKIKKNIKRRHKAWKKY